MTLPLKIQFVESDVTLLVKQVKHFQWGLNLGVEFHTVKRNHCRQKGFLVSRKVLKSKLHSKCALVWFYNVLLVLTTLNKYKMKWPWSFFDLNNLFLPKWFLLWKKCFILLLLKGNGIIFKILAYFSLHKYNSFIMVSLQSQYSHSFKRLVLQRRVVNTGIQK